MVVFHPSLMRRCYDIKYNYTHYKGSYPEYCDQGFTFLLMVPLCHIQAQRVSIATTANTSPGGHNNIATTANTSPGGHNNKSARIKPASMHGTTIARKSTLITFGSGSPHIISDICFTSSPSRFSIFSSLLDELHLPLVFRLN